MARDLTRSGYHAVNGEPVVEIAASTLAAGASMVETWRKLEPIVKTLTAKVETYARRPDVKAVEAAKLLHLAAGVVQKVAAASTGMLRATEGQAKLALLLSAGTVKRRPASELSEKQLLGVWIAFCERAVADGKPCPGCGTQPARVVVAPRSETEVPA